MKDGFYVIDVTDPTAPKSVGHYVNPMPDKTEFRCLAIDQETGMLGVTEQTIFVNQWSNNQFGYARFYDIAANPADPAIVGQERLAEGWSGVPDKLVMANGYAYIVNIASGLQVVDVAAAHLPHAPGYQYGDTIVGGYDTYAGGYGSPYDIAMVNNGTILLATGNGNLLLIDARRPPQVELIKDVGKQPGRAGHTRHQRHQI